MNSTINLASSLFNGQQAPGQQAESLSAAINDAIRDYRNSGGECARGFYIDAEVNNEGEYSVTVSFTPKDSAWLCVYEPGSDDNQVMSLYAMEDPAEVSRIAQLLMAYDFIRVV